MWISTVERALKRGGKLVKGMAELEAGRLPGRPEEGRIRAVGGGRKRLEDADPHVKRVLARLVEASTAGDPMSYLLWTNKSTRNLADELARQGYTVSHVTVARCLRELGYSLQANVKTIEGTQHPDRDTQFRYLNDQVRRFVRRHDPVVSVDTKKKEWVGSFENRGRQWQPAGDPEAVQVHDFPAPGVGKAIPYGTYDVTRDEAVVNVGITHETAEFAVESIRRWWQAAGTEGLSSSPASVDLRGCRGQQRHAAARLESPCAGPGRSAGDGADGVPLPTRHEQVEQGRASGVFVHQHELARAARSSVTRLWSI
jgi:hypothetical protein